MSDVNVDELHIRRKIRISDLMMFFIDRGGIIKTDMKKEELIKYLIKNSRYNIKFDGLNDGKNTDVRQYNYNVVYVPRKDLSRYLSERCKNEEEFVRNLRIIESRSGIVVNSNILRNFVLKKYGLDDEPEENLKRIQESLKKGEWKIY